jgi:hypothetical protein
MLLKGLLYVLPFSTMSISIVVRRPAVGRERIDTGCVCDFRSEGILYTFPALLLHMRDVKLLFSAMRSSVTSIG